MNYYPFNIGDYSAHTAFLDPLEDIAYRRLLDIYYLHESPLENDIDKLSKAIRMRTHSDCIEYVLKEFFVLKKGKWHNAGADKVLSKIYDKSEIYCVG